MKKMLYISTRKNADIRCIFKFIEYNINFFVYISLFIGGLIIGTISVYYYPSLNLITTELFLCYEDIFCVFFKNIILYFSFYIALFIFGLCGIGSPMILFANLFNGLYYGALFSVYCMNPDNYGILQFLILRFPSAIIFTITIILSSEIAMEMCSYVKIKLIGANNRSLDFVRYIKQFLLIMIFGLFSAIIDVIVVCIFKNI